MKKIVPLPASEARLLRELYVAQDRPTLYARVLALRSAGWPIARVAELFGISRTAIDHWMADALATPDTVVAADALLADSAVPLLPPAPPPELADRRVYLRVPDDEAARLRELVPVAKRLRANTARVSAVRSAVTELRALLDLNVRERGVTAMNAARAAGLTRRAVVLHLDKFTLANAAVYPYPTGAASAPDDDPAANVYVALTRTGPTTFDALAPAGGEPAVFTVDEVDDLVQRYFSPASGPGLEIGVRYAVTVADAGRHLGLDVEVPARTPVPA